MSSLTEKVVLGLLVEQIKRDGDIPGAFLRNAGRSESGAAMESICRCSVTLGRGGLPKITRKNKSEERHTVYDASVLIKEVCEREGRACLILDLDDQLDVNNMVPLIKDRKKIYSSLLAGAVLCPEDRFSKRCLDQFWWGDQNGDDEIKDEFDRKANEIISMGMGFEETRDSLRSLFEHIPLEANKRLFIGSNSSAFVDFIKRSVKAELS